MPDPNGSGESKLSGGQFGMEFVLTFIVVYAFCASRDARYEERSVVLTVHSVYFIRYTFARDSVEISEKLRDRIMLSREK